MSTEFGILHDIRSNLQRRECSLVQLQAEYAENPMPHNNKEIKRQLDEYRDAADRELHYFERPAAARRYGEQERPGKLLAQTVSSEKGNTAIPCITTKDGVVINRVEEVFKVFYDFYEALYSPQSEATSDEIDEYLAKIPMTLLSADARDALEAPIALSEIKETIKSLP